MGRDEDLPRGDVGRVLTDENPSRPKIGQDCLVVDQISEDRHGARRRSLLSQLDGIPNPKTHPHRFCF